MNVAIVGATGAVGKALISVLSGRKFPVKNLVPFASSRSLGKPITLNGGSYPCQVLKPGCFDGIDIAFFDASDAISKEWVPQAAASGAWVVDNSSTFRMEEDVPLLVPEVNGDLLLAKLRDSRSLKPRERILAGPNCSTVQMVVALRPLHKKWGLKRVTVSTYQSVSGAGAAAMDELSEQTLGRLNGGMTSTPQVFKHPIAFNCIPQIGSFVNNPLYPGYTSEEQKIMEETRKILGLPNLRISATAVRVPTYACHGESVQAEFEKPVSVEEARQLLQEQPGVLLEDDPANHSYPMGLNATGGDAVHVGRIRRDLSVENGLNLWVVSDNLRKGAALNAVQIGEVLLQAWVRS